VLSDGRAFVPTVESLTETVVVVVVVVVAVVVVVVVSVVTGAEVVAISV